MSTEVKNAIRVMLGDDQQLLLSMYRKVLESHGIEVIAECKSTEDVVQTYKEMKPDVVLLDIRFGTTKTGFDAMSEIYAFDPSANIVVISQFDHTPYITKAYKLGAKSFLTKNCDENSIIQAITMASKGQSWHMPFITDKIMQSLTSTDVDPSSVLSEEDFKIFMYLAEGKRNSEIAELIDHPLNYVSNHRQKIQSILKIDREQQFTLLAIRCGLMEA